jgi:hypothetical protein
LENELLESINRNLEVVIALLLRSLPGADAASLRDRVLMLEAIGMRPRDMAKVTRQISEPHKQRTIGWQEHDEEGEVQK